MLWKVTLLVWMWIRRIACFDAQISENCEDSYYIQTGATSSNFQVKINKTFYVCSFESREATESEDSVIIGDQFVNLGIQPTYHLFFSNGNNQRIEANITWEFNSMPTSYIMQIQKLSDHNQAKCINIDVNELKGDLFGKYIFPTRLSIRCYGMWSDSDGTYSVTVWQKREENCTCLGLHTERTPYCKKLCTYQRKMNVPSRFYFMRNACLYWSQHREPTLALIIKPESSTEASVTILSTDVNPYTVAVVALFEDNNPRFPILEFQRPPTQTTSFRFSRRIRNLNHSMYYAVIYYYCYGRNKSATVSFISNEVYLAQETNNGAPLFVQNTGDQQRPNIQHKILVVGTLVAALCISIGIFVAAVLFYKRKHANSCTSGSGKGRVWNNQTNKKTDLHTSEADTEENILQPTVCFNTESHVTLGLLDENEKEHTFLKDTCQ